MAKNQIIIGSKEVSKLVDTLARCPHVTEFDEGPNKASTSLAYCFDSLEGHFREFLDNQLPRLEDGNLSAQEVCDLFQDVGTTFGQILWHIGLPKFYRYLKDDEG